MKLRITRDEAVALGFTHEGAFSFLPIWAKDIETEAPLLWAKYPPTEWLFPVVAFFQETFGGTDYFQVKLAEIEVPNA